MTDPRKQVWHIVHIDYCGPFPFGECFFVAVDETSKYPEVHVTRSCSAATAITHLTQMFATHGIPEVITSDNVPFGSEEFPAWCKQLGIRHRKITPLWSAANAQVERFNKTVPAKNAFAGWALNFSVRMWNRGPPSPPTFFVLITFWCHPHVGALFSWLW